MSIADATFYAVVYMQYGNNMNPALPTTVILLSKYETSDVKTPSVILYICYVKAATN